MGGRPRGSASRLTRGALHERLGEDRPRPGTSATRAGELKLVPGARGNGYDDLRRGANREPLGRGVRPSVALVADHARMRAALNREHDLEKLQTTRRLIELERQCTRSRGLSRER